MLYNFVRGCELGFDITMMGSRPERFINSLSFQYLTKTIELDFSNIHGRGQHPSKKEIHSFILDEMAVGAGMLRGVQHHPRFPKVHLQFLNEDDLKRAEIKVKDGLMMKAKKIKIYGYRCDKPMISIILNGQDMDIEEMEIRRVMGLYGEVVTCERGKNVDLSTPAHFVTDGTWSIRMTPSIRDKPPETIYYYGPSGNVQTWILNFDGMGSSCVLCGVQGHMGFRCNSLVPRGGRMGRQPAGMGDWTDVVKCIAPVVPQPHASQPRQEPAHQVDQGPRQGPVHQPGQGPQHKPAQGVQQQQAQGAQQQARQGPRQQPGQGPAHQGGQVGDKGGEVNGQGEQGKQGKAKPDSVKTAQTDKSSLTEKAKQSKEVGMSKSQPVGGVFQKPAQEVPVIPGLSPEEQEGQKNKLKNKRKRQKKKERKRLLAEELSVGNPFDVTEDEEGGKDDEESDTSGDENDYVDTNENKAFIGRVASSLGTYGTRRAFNLVKMFMKDDLAKSKTRGARVVSKKEIKPANKRRGSINFSCAKKPKGKRKRVSKVQPTREVVGERVEPDMEVGGEGLDKDVSVTKVVEKPMVEKDIVESGGNKEGGDDEKIDDEAKENDKETKEIEETAQKEVSEAKDDDDKDKSAEVSEENTEKQSVKLLESQGIGGATQYTQLDRTGFAQGLVGSGSLESEELEKVASELGEKVKSQEEITEEQEVLLASQKIKSLMETEVRSSLPSSQDDN